MAEFVARSDHADGYFGLHFRQVGFQGCRPGAMVTRLEDLRAEFIPRRNHTFLGFFFRVPGKQESDAAVFQPQDDGIVVPVLEKGFRRVEDGEYEVANGNGVAPFGVIDFGAGGLFRVDGIHERDYRIALGGRRVFVHNFLNSGEIRGRSGGSRKAEKKRKREEKTARRKAIKGK